MGTPLLMIIDRKCFEEGLAGYLAGRPISEQVQWLRGHGVDATAEWTPDQLRRAISNEICRMPDLWLGADAQRLLIGAGGIVSAGIMNDLADARARRLSTIQEILEACDQGHVDIDLMTEVLTEGLQQLGPEPDRPQPLDDDERRLMCALSTVVGACRNLTWFMAERMKRGRARGQMEKLPDKIKRMIEDVFMPRVQLMPRTEAAKLQLELLNWAYVIWSPGEQVAMFRLLELAAEGKYIPKEERQRASEFLNRYRASMPMGNRSTGGS